MKKERQSLNQQVSKITSLANDLLLDTLSNVKQTLNLNQAKKFIGKEQVGFIVCSISI
jgi:hypothetical protein